MATAEDYQDLEYAIVGNDSQDYADLERLISNEDMDNNIRDIFDFFKVQLGNRSVEITNHCPDRWNTCCSDNCCNLVYEE